MEVESLLKKQTLRSIELERLVPHVGCPNHMPADRLTKLRRLIELTGYYEPLIVRPHPKVRGEYEVIDGRNRLMVLQALQLESVQCSVWKLNDDETALCLATINRLSGRDIPERRAVLLRGLLDERSPEELCELLPDGEHQIMRLLEIANFDTSEEVRQRTETPNETVSMGFMLHREEHRVLNLALDVAQHQSNDGTRRGSALVTLAHHYLSRESLPTLPESPDGAET